MNKFAIALFVNKNHKYIQEPDKKIIFNSPDEEEEVRVCLEKKFPLFYLVNPQGRIMVPHGSQNPYGGFDITDTEGNIIPSLKGFTLLLRTSVHNIWNNLLTVENAGGTNLVSWEDQLQVERWYNFVLPEFLKRKISVFPSAEFGEIIEKNLELITKHEQNEKVFLKSTHKGFPTCLANMRDREDQNEILCALLSTSENSDIIVSDPINIERDDTGRLEYRTFVVLGKVANTSRYYSKDQLGEIPQAVTEYVQNFVIAHKDIFPHSYVLDVAIDSARGPIIIEMNGINASGRYGKNNFEDILNILKN
jgi:hypothetical protein